MTLLFLASTSSGPTSSSNGLTTGSIYALIALGYTMVYGVLQLINFAHGEVFMVGAFAGYGMLLAFGGEDVSGAMIDLRAHHRSPRPLARVGADSADDRANRLPPAAQRPAAGAADQRHRCERLPQPSRRRRLPERRAEFYPQIFPVGRHLRRAVLSVSYLQLFLMGRRWR